MWEYSFTTAQQMVGVSQAWFKLVSVATVCILIFPLCLLSHKRNLCDSLFNAADNLAGFSHYTEKVQLALHIQCRCVFMCIQTWYLHLEIIHYYTFL